jgi:hypothetical protein
MTRTLKKPSLVYDAFGLWLARWLGIVFFQLLIALVLLEVVARIFDPFGISYYPETAAYLNTMVREEPIGYRNQPNFSGRFWGVDVAINSLGMRDREITAPPSANEFRILIMGDSFPFGIGQPLEHSIPRQLEGQLNRSYGGRPFFRTLNMGVISYNTEQELIQLKTVGMKLQPNLVILFYSINDIQPKMWVVDRRRRLANLLQHSYAASLLLVLYQEVHVKFTGRDDRIHVDVYRNEHPDSRWSIVESSIVEMYQLCKAAQIPFVIFTRFEDTRFEERKTLRMRFEALRTRLRFPVVDLDRKSDPRWKNENPASLRNSRVDSHPTKLGGEVYATLAFEALQRLNVLPRSDTGVSSVSHP